jgi:hypothetical protein
MDNENGVQYAALWITSCIALHAFAMDHENRSHFSTDRFYREGHRIMRVEMRECAEWQAEREEHIAREEEKGDIGQQIELLEGKLKREELKKVLFTYLVEDQDM